jgi:Raf kinase inhibitor-like YbhB/YbcL family protein
MPLNIKDLAISSPDIRTGERVPDKHAADHGNAEPALTISGVPEGAVELAVIAHDPDAPLPHGFTHWVLYGLEPTDGTVNGSHRTGPNTIGERAYSGPQPPPGHGVHHYYFWVYALDRAVEGEPTREEFLTQYADSIIEQNRFVATYSS